MVLLEDLYCGLSAVLKLVNFSFELFGRLSLKSKDLPFLVIKKGKSVGIVLVLYTNMLKLNSMYHGTT